MAKPIYSKRPVKYSYNRADWEVEVVEEDSVVKGHTTSAGNSLSVISEAQLRLKAKLMVLQMSNKFHRNFPHYKSSSADAEQDKAF